MASTAMKQSLVDGAIFQQLQQDDDRACVSASRGAQRKRSLRNTAAVVAPFATHIVTGASRLSPVSPPR